MLIYRFGNPPTAEAPKGVAEHLFKAFLRRDSLAGTGLRHGEGAERAKTAAQQPAGKDRMVLDAAGWSYWR
jgi:hypothetical protein